MGSGVGIGVGTEVGIGVGSGVGIGVGTEVGSGVGIGVGSGVGSKPSKTKLSELRLLLFTFLRIAKYSLEFLS